MSPKHGRGVRAARWIPLAAAVAAVMAIAGAAVALGAVQRRATTSIPSHKAGSATARCKHGQSALAAGFATPGFDPITAEGPVARFSSMPAGRRGAKTRAFNFGSQAGELDSFTYCGKRARPPRIRSKSVQVLPNTAGSVVARCPRGSVSIAGGFASTGSPNAGSLIITFTSKRAGKRGWKAAGFNIGNPGNPPRRLTAYAYCRKPGPKIVAVSKTRQVPTGSLRTVDVKCHHHRKALSGGFNGHFHVTQTQQSGTAALTSRRVTHGRAWRTVSLGVSQQSGRSTTYAYCRR